MEILCKDYVMLKVYAFVAKIIINLPTGKFITIVSFFLLTYITIKKRQISINNVNVVGYINVRME